MKKTSQNELGLNTRHGLFALMVSVLIVMHSSGALAFAEMTRFQYNTCAACHVAPSGGGLLTSYGKSLSSEVLSTWGTESEAGFMHGLLDSKLQREALEKWILIGGDVRAVQVHKEDAIMKQGRFVKMQAELALGFVRDLWAAVINFGELQDSGPGDDGLVWRDVGTQYYALMRPIEELSFRVGRFVPQYGLFTNDHIAFVRNFSGFGLSARRDVIEAQWTGPAWSGSLSYSKQFAVEAPERSWTAQVQYSFYDRYKLAFNLMHSDGASSSQDTKTDLLGVWGVLGFTKNFFWLNEIDRKAVTTAATGSTADTSVGWASYQKFGYTLFKGFDALLYLESQQSDLRDNQTRMRRVGPGFQFFPRPHFELSGAATHQLIMSGDPKESFYAWLLLHYYL